MIEINLLPQEFQKKESKKLKLPPLPTMRYFMMSLLMLALMEGCIFLINMHKGAHLETLKASYEKMSPELGDIEKLKIETSQMQKKLKLLRGLTHRPFYWTEIAEGISEELTEGIWLTNLAIREESAGSSGGRSKHKRGRKGGDSKAEDVKLSLVIQGLSDSNRGGTATVAKFIQNLEKNEVYEETFSRIWLERIGRSRTESSQLFDFSINCLFKKSVTKRVKRQT